MRRSRRDPRDNAIRVAVVGSSTTLAANLREMANSPTVREFDDLFESATALSEFAPAVLCFARGEDFDQDLGAVRMLRALLPELATVMSCEVADLTEACRVKCASNEVHILDSSRGPLEVERVFTRAVTGGSATASYLQFVQGICDEINNPLMFASGHLRLLETRLDATADRDALTQITAVRQGLERIQGTMRKVGAMGRATQVERRRGEFSVGSLVEATERQIRDAALTAGVACGESERSVILEGDVDLVSGALFGLCQVGCELNHEREPIALRIDQARSGVALRMEVRNARLEEWELPRAFEPYHLNDILRGTTLGLNLFLVRIVTRAHGWDAFARRLPDRSVEFCIGAGAMTDTVGSTDHDGDSASDC